MKTQTNTDGLINLLISDKNSPLHKFRNKVPTDDLSYLTHWFEFLEYTLNNKNIVSDIIDYGIEIEKFETNYVLQNKLKHFIVETHSEILSKIGFEPRLEQYVKSFPNKEQSNIRLLILANLIKKNKNNGLTGIGFK